MVNKIKTLKNLNKKFPRFQLETLLTIIDCIEDEVTIFPVTSNPGVNEPIKPIFETPYTPTCSNKVASTTDQYNPNQTLTATKEYTPQEYYEYRKCKETSYKNGEEETNEVVATNDNGDVHVYVNGEECGMEFPAKNKKEPHLCDKTSCKVNVLTEEDDYDDEDYENYETMNNDIFCELYDKLIKKISR